MTGAVVYFEVLGQDLAQLRAFYGEMFNWQFRDVPEAKYALVQHAEGGIGGGIGASPQGDSWSTFYVQVDSLAESIERAKGMGGRLLMPPVQMPEGSSYAVIADPEGHPVGLYQTA